MLDPARGGSTTPNDPSAKELVRRFKLKRGAYIQADGANANAPAQGSVYSHMDGLSLKDRKSLFRFDQLTTIQPKEKLNLKARRADDHTVLDLLPTWKRATQLDRASGWQTTILHDIASGIEENHPECHLMVLL